MPLSPRQQDYWGRNCLLIWLLLAVWFVVTFVAADFADELNHIQLIGPLGFYLGAQGAPIIYLIIVGIYARVMNRLDREEDET